jgi:hypothetical protein
MNDIAFRRIVHGVFPFVLLMLIFSSCKEDDDLPPEPALPARYKIVITDIVDMPSDLTFDRIKADIIGESWKVIGSVEAPYEHGEAVLTLPIDFSADTLQQVEQTKENKGGRWPATSSDPDALVASLSDLNAYAGDVKVGRAYLTDWPPGKGSSSAGKAFIYYHYADRPFTVSGENINLYGSKAFQPSYTYSLEFKKGWNAYANINSATPGQGLTSCTTTLPDETQLQWRFESH